MRLLVVAAVLAAGCGDNEVGPPLAPSDTVVVVAHQDDDMLFMQPDLGERIAQHFPTTFVSVTAGDNGDGIPFAQGRIEGSKGSYGLIAGTTAWNCGWIAIASHDA